MKKQIIIAIIAGLLFGTICCFVAKAQTFTFTQATPPTMVLPTQTNNGSYTFTIDKFTADDYFHRTMDGVGIWSMGDNFAYLNYYTLVWVTTYTDAAGRTVENKSTFDLSGWYGSNRIAEKKPHRLIFTRNANTKKLYIDSVSYYSIKTNTDSVRPQSGFSAPIYMSDSRPSMRLSGTVSNVSFNSTYTETVKNEVVGINVKGDIDTIQYPLNYDPYSNNYNNVPTPVEQYQKYPLAQWHPKSVQQYGSLCIELKYQSGYNPSLTNNYTLISNNGKFMSLWLAQNSHYGWRVCSNINSWYSDYTHGDYCFDCQVMSLAKDYPNIRKDIGSSMCQTDNIPPYIAANLSNVTSGTGLEYFSGTRNITFLQASLLRSTLASYGIADTGILWWEDAECQSELVGTDNWVRNYKFMLDSGQSIFPRIKSTGYNLYSYWWSTTSLKFPANLGIGNLRYATPSMYLERPKDWCNLNGTEKGWQAICRYEYDQISNGYPMMTPFVSPGWSVNIENNMQPAQFSGLVGILQVMGTEYFFPSFFTTGGNVQDPKGYCYIAPLVSMVSASVSNPKYWNIIENGTLMRGTSSGIINWEYNIWCNNQQPGIANFEIITVAKKLGTEYIIATTRQKGNVAKPLNGRKIYWNPILPDGTDLSGGGFFTSEKACIWYFNSANPIVVGINPKLISTQVPYKHLSRVNTTPSALDDN